MTDNTDFFRMLERMLRAGARRAGNSDEYDLKHFVSLKDKLNEEIKNAVKQQLDNGKSWKDIGDAIGISRQGAFKKYS